MIASSSTVLSNLAYLIGAVAVAVIAGLFVWLRHRQPKSVDANMASFRRGLNALAPEAGSPGARPEEPRVRPVPAGPSHVRIEPAATGGRRSTHSVARSHRPGDDDEGAGAG
jgi:hypothetical protein